MSDRARNPGQGTELLDLTAQIVAAYVKKNVVDMAEITLVIQQVHSALRGLSVAPESAPVALIPAVPIKKSVTPDYLVCLEDGKKLKMLKRHLRSVYGMTPEQYRTKWSLPLDYPMVAPNYAERRSEFAKKIGLGRSGARSRSRVSALS